MSIVPCSGGSAFHAAESRRARQMGQRDLPRWQAQFGDLEPCPDAEDIPDSRQSVQSQFSDEGIPRHRQWLG
ncbi:hypothetical protein QRO11_15095 [Paracidovorax citrulli]|uniref:hypothetical protein n=1 Tax=Paracidovorax citrulli TaxID=80869 RepID=UPI0002E2F388|nr:hypothetical protein [Paracidovorax citrulli]QCX12223.1 hypothetical protein APS58_3469 [Paracidovorax citrulli]UEG44810.1 hypothetical protein LKW27_14245 [Paracidovorax citrulli]UMT87844.1 hypothetical protein FRC90_06990 [Paracidovorax citrulli]UMT97456.1 hypothetical protein FRC97_22145 [Paracidovorax citrulli]WIY33275.1 hypothetical protein QRO11_15095 [Paracidovorax citrulli]